MWSSHSLCLVFCCGRIIRAALGTASTSILSSQKGFPLENYAAEPIKRSLCSSVSKHSGVYITRTKSLYIFLGDSSKFSASSMHFFTLDVGCNTKQSKNKLNIQSCHRFQKSDKKQAKLLLFKQWKGNGQANKWSFINYVCKSRGVVQKCWRFVNVHRVENVNKILAYFDHLPPSG